MEAFQDPWDDAPQLGFCEWLAQAAPHSATEGHVWQSVGNTFDEALGLERVRCGKGYGIPMQQQARACHDASARKLVTVQVHWLGELAQSRGGRRPQPQYLGDDRRPDRGLRDEALGETRPLSELIKDVRKRDRRRFLR